MRDCRIPECGRQTTGRSHYCTAHKTRDRRHGHPLQETITKTVLKPYVSAVGTWVDRQGADDLWSKIEGNWLVLVDWARGVLASYARGRPMYHPEVEAARAIVAAADDLTPRKVAETIAAMGLLWAKEPHLFKSDRAAWVQTARRFLGLSERNAGMWWHEGEGRMRRTYKDIPPRNSVFLGRLLMAALGIIGTHVHEAQKRHEATAERLRREMLERLTQHA